MRGLTPVLSLLLILNQILPASSPLLSDRTDNTVICVTLARRLSLLSRRHLALCDNPPILVPRGIMYRFAMTYYEHIFVLSCPLSNLRAVLDEILQLRDYDRSWYSLPELVFIEKTPIHLWFEILGTQRIICSSKTV